MKVLKLPIDMKINCECGCDFEFDTDDIEQVGYTLMNGTTYSRVVVDCPFCKCRHILHEKIIKREIGVDE